MKNKLLLNTLIFCALVGLIGGYLNTQIRFYAEKNTINKKLESIFNNKKTVIDGTIIIPRGQLVGNKFMPDERSFTVCELTKSGNGIIKYFTMSGEITYFKDEYRYVEYFGKVSNFRPTVSQCYNNMYSYLINGDKNEKKEFYAPNTYVDIDNFPYGYDSSYFEFVETEHPTEKNINDLTWGDVQNSSGFMMFFSKLIHYYELKPKEKEQKSYLLYNLIIWLLGGLSFGFIIFKLLRSKNMGSSRNTQLFGTKWLNIENRDILSIEEKIMGKLEAILVEGDKIKKGKAILDKDNKLEIIFGDNIYYYKIELLTDNKLELKNLASNSLMKFEKLGTNAYELELDKETL